jgi:hypothetical protein
MIEASKREMNEEFHHALATACASLLPTATAFVYTGLYYFKFEFESRDAEQSTQFLLWDLATSQCHGI